MLIKKNIFKHIVSYSGLVIELVSDEMQILEINFSKDKIIKVNDKLSDPLKKAVSV